MSSNQKKLIKRIAILILPVIFIGLLATVEFKYWPWLLRNVHSARTEGRNHVNYRLDCTIRDCLNSVWYPHAKAILNVEKDFFTFPPQGPHPDKKGKNRIRMEDLKPLLDLPGVKDAFYIDFESNFGQSFSNVIPSDSLNANLNVFGKKGSGGGARMMRRTVGGLTRFKQVEIGNDLHIVMVRYLGTYYPNYSSAVIGLVLNMDWFFPQVPSLLDSLAQNSTNLLFFAPAPEDTFWINNEDKYAAPGDNFKQTIGVLNGEDTLWWHGNRQEYMKYDYVDMPDWGYEGGTDFGISILIKSEFPNWDKAIRTGRNAVKIVFPLLEITALALIGMLIIGFYLVRKQARRNKVALGHFAHAIKTPVARLKLAADLLSEGHVDSPTDETQLISSITGECDRLGLAVKNAAISLEDVKLKLQLEKVDLSSLITDITEAWQPTFRQSGIELITNVSNQPMIRQLDREKITMVIENLIDNALRHTYLNMPNLSSGNARVAIKLDIAGDKVRISVDDSGAGIPEPDRKKVLRQFHRTETSALTGATGLGLGLAIAKEITEAHKGKLTIGESEWGGARFSVDIP